MFVNLGLIGYPLGHTFSPTLHTHFLDAAGVNGGYTCYETPSASDIPSLINMFRRYSFAGVNVTVPYKIEIMKYCDELDVSAEKAGAVNTLCFCGGKILGCNTDVYGFGKMLEDASVFTDNKNMLLLGAGGAARAVAAYLESRPPACLTIANRTETRAQELASSCGFKTLVSNMESIRSGKYDIIVNSTSLGLKGEPFPFTGAVSEAAADLQYKPALTPFLAAYENESVKKINGFSMLVWQACRSFELWTGKRLEPDMKKLSAAAYGVKN